jgi:dTMP kinase
VADVFAYAVVNLKNHLKNVSTKYSGLFISVDGPNGVGKSTLIDAIKRHLIRKNLRVHLTKEVTPTPIGKFVRDYHKTYHGKTLAFLLAADRQNHIENDILPALRNHDVVITDRYVDSSLVFQRLDGVELSFLWKINADFLKPDLSILVVAPAEVITSRMASRNTFDRFEGSFSRADEIRLFKKAAAFLQKKGFNVRKFDNGGDLNIEVAAGELSDEIIHLRSKRFKLL